MIEKMKFLSITGPKSDISPSMKFILKMLWHS